MWAYDFVHARTHDGQPLRMLVMVDELTRECLAIDVAGHLTSEDVLERLAWSLATGGVPPFVRSDNGSEFTAEAVRSWLAKVGVKTRYLEPGSPWENGYVESFNGKLGEELLDREIFYTLLEAKVLIERWRGHYNRVRPHRSLGYRPPAPAAVVDTGPRRAALHCAGAPFRPPLDDRKAHGGSEIYIGLATKSFALNYCSYKGLSLGWRFCGLSSRQFVLGVCAILSFAFYPTNIGVNGIGANDKRQANDRLSARVVENMVCCCNW